MSHSELLISLLNSCTVRVSTVDESGAGFFVAPGLVLTCAHVIQKAQQKMSSITVQWEDQKYTAQIEHLASATYPDLALLLLENVPSTHPCVFLHREINTNDQLYSYGYPQNYPQGDPTLLNFEGLTGGPLRFMKFKFGEVRPGFSGSPLLNKRTGGVCGLIKSTRGEDSLMGGRGIPTDDILMTFPELGDLQIDYHQKDSHWYKLLSKQQRNLLGFKAPQKPLRSIEVYYSFAKKDEYFAKQLQKHLSLLKQPGSITEWYPQEIALGVNANALNRQHLNTAQIILLLVSPDFISEKVGRPENSEVKTAMRRSKEGAVVIPIKLRPLKNWDLTQFSKLTSLPRNDLPVSEWRDIDMAFAEIAEEIRGVVDRLKSS